MLCGWGERERDFLHLASRQRRSGGRIEQRNHRRSRPSTLGYRQLFAILGPKWMFFSYRSDKNNISVSISRVFTFFFENISDIFFYKSPWWIISSARSKKKDLIGVDSVVSCVCSCFSTIRTVFWTAIRHGIVIDLPRVLLFYRCVDDWRSEIVWRVWIAFWPVPKWVGSRCQRSLLRRIQSFVVVVVERRPVQWSVPHAISGLPQALPDQHRLVWNVHLWRFLDTRPRRQFARF